MAKNIQFFSNKVKDKNDKSSVSTMIEDLDNVLNDILKEQMIKSFEKDNSMSNVAYNQSASFDAKIEACYSLNIIGMDVRAILFQFNIIKHDFHSFGDFNTRNYIKEIIRLSKSELFDLILNMIKEKKLEGIKLEKLENLIDSLGYRGALQFIFSVIAAALIENIITL